MWIQSNGEGQGNINFRVGPSLDNIPVYALRIDPNDEDILWIGLQDNGGLLNHTMEVNFGNQN